MRVRVPSWPPFTLGSSNWIGRRNLTPKTRVRAPHRAPFSKYPNKGPLKINIADVGRWLASGLSTRSRQSQEGSIPFIGAKLLECSIRLEA